MEVALSSHKSMVIAALLDPSGEVPQPIESEARGRIEMVFHIGHVLHGAIFFDVPPLFPALEEVGEELLLHFGPFCLLEGGNIILIVNLEDMLKVLPPPGASVISSILERVFR